jgi:hypothetical protein
MRVDILLAGDFRFPAGTSTSIASEVRALAKANYSIGLLALATAPLAARRGIHPEIRALVDRGLARFVPLNQPIKADLTLLHHPMAFERLPAVPPLVTSRKTLLIVHHPVVDAAGVMQYDHLAVSALVRALFGPVVWAPVGPKVRQTLEQLAVPPPMTPEDWINVIDPDDWIDRQSPQLPRSRPVIGRHSRPQPVKWPADRETFLAAYPDAPDVRVRLMGYSEALDQLVGERPANWEVLAFGALPVRDFLHSLDYFSYFHGPDWIEAFGRAVLEAMATGLVCLLPPDFRNLFGDAAIYCEPAEVLDHVRRLEKDCAARAELSARAVQVVRERFGPDRAVARVAALIGPPSRRPAEASQGARILYFTSNGVGMGHLTRCLATARRLPAWITPVVVTMSKSFGAVRDEGFAVEYLPYFKSIGIDDATWTAKLREDLGAILGYHAPDVFVFDGNVPYDGMRAALADRPQMWRVWQRRAMWRPGVGEEHLALAPTFDTVIEPGELAAPIDRGLTVSMSAEALCVPPIRILDDNEALPRQAARALLGLDQSRPAMLLQLGSGNNFDLNDTARIVFDLADPNKGGDGLQVVFARWRIAESDQTLPGFVRVLDAFPIARHLAAFDCAVATAGYNTFHENLAAGLPTLFVANDSPEQDEQWLRAEYAALRGMALAARAWDPHGIRRGVELLLQPATQARLAVACAAARPENGAKRKRSELVFRPVPPEVTG